MTISVFLLSIKTKTDNKKYLIVVSESLSQLEILLTITISIIKQKCLMDECVLRVKEDLSYFIKANRPAV